MYFDANKRSLLLAGGFFVITILVLVLMVLFYDFAGSNMSLLLGLLTIVSILSLTKIVYDASRNYEEDKNFSGQLTKATTIESYELYTELYRNSPVPYLLINYAGEIVSSNLAAQRFLGIRAGNDVGVSVFERLRSDDSDHLQFALEKYQNKISFSDETVKVIRLDNSEAWALLSIFQFNSKTGEHLGLADPCRYHKAKED